MSTHDIPFHKYSFASNFKFLNVHIMTTQMGESIYIKVTQHMTNLTKDCCYNCRACSQTCNNHCKDEAANAHFKRTRVLTTVSAKIGNNKILYRQQSSII